VGPHLDEHSQPRAHAAFVGADEIQPPYPNQTPAVLRRTQVLAEWIPTQRLRSYSCGDSAFFRFIRPS
jgi:hypothetical protein